MTKDEELAVLDSAIHTLGPDSYIGPWLERVRASVEMDIRSDLPPCADLHEHRRMLDDQLKRHCASISRLDEEHKANLQRQLEAHQRDLKAIGARVERLLNEALFEVERITHA